MADYPTRIDLCDGKYTLIYDFSTGQSECLRYGEPWRQLVGDKMVLACFDEIVELRQEVSQLRETLESLAIDFISDSDRIEIAVAAINKAKGI